MVTEWFHELLLESAVLRVFLVVAVGYMLGEVRFPGGFRLGVAAVLFTGLAFGALIPEFALPEVILTVGLVLFVYTVGLEVAPGFLQTLRRDGLRANLAMTVALLVVFTVAWTAIFWTGRPLEMMAGIFCGALTNTPALGAVIDTLTQTGGDPEALNAAVVGFGVVYPFSVLAVLLPIQIRCARLRRRAAPQSLIASLPPPRTIEVRHLKEGRPWRAVEVAEETGLLFTRMRRPEGQLELVRTDSTLEPGTLIVAVGNNDQFARGVELLGVQAVESLQENLKGFEIHRYFVSNPKVGGRTLAELGLESMGAVVTRVRRGDIDLPVQRDLVLHPGDRVRVLSYRETEPVVRKFFGNSLHVISEMGYFSFAVGVVLGLILGAIPIPLPGLREPLYLGVAGGPLIVALILGNVGRTGPFVWNIPITVNQTVRHLGILLFFAAIGIRAGGGFLEMLQQDGVFLIVMGVSLVLLGHFTLWLTLWAMKQRDLAAAMGMSAGFQTQPAALVFAQERADRRAVTVAYAAVYPLALILKIILVQFFLIVG